MNKTFFMSDSGGRFVLTGGPGVGKTTVIQELARCGYQVVPEAFHRLHTEAEKRGTLSTFFHDQLQLRRDLIYLQRKMELGLDVKSPAFLDRSLVDIIAFGDYFNIEMPEELRAYAHQKYDLIFFLEPLPCDYYKNTSARRESYEESKVIHCFLKKAYQDQRYDQAQLINVPFGSLAMRAECILDCVASLSFP